MNDKELLKLVEKLQKALQNKEKVHTSKRIRRFPKTMPEEDLKKIIKAIDKSPRYNKNRYFKNFLKLRDSALFQFLYNTGLRPKEALNLKWSDVDFEKRLIKIDAFSNKERNEMDAILTLPAKRVLEKYKKQFAAKKIPSEYIFPQAMKWDLPLDTEGASMQFRQICKECGLDQVQFYRKDGQPKYNYGLYTFRRTFATRVYEKTKDIYSVMKLMRHTTMKSIPSYVIYDDKNRIGVADDVFK